MGALLGRIVSDYLGLLEICRQRAQELGISRLGIDERSRLAPGMAGKLLGKSAKEKHGTGFPGSYASSTWLKIVDCRG